eukprot:1150069-Pelagomonas_calceolata.AAC.5
MSSIPGGIQRKPQPPASKVRHPSLLIPKKGTSILWTSNTVKIQGPRISSRPSSSSTATSVAIFQGL